VCFLQVFVRWALPRFRYDQLMRLGWRLLLPASFANIFVTGVVWLALDKAGPQIAGGLRVAADLSQALVAVGTAMVALWLVVAFVGPVKHQRTLLGSSADAAAKRGGTKSAPMQA
jgi:NADH-quinone oxidoreductase subunit H